MFVLDTYVTIEFYTKRRKGGGGTILFVYLQSTFTPLPIK
jgi:hypothetical protein